VKNLKVPVYRKVRRKDEAGNSLYCPSHQSKLVKHKASHPCGITCSKIRELQKEIKECGNCQNPELFTNRVRKQITKCEQVIDLVVIKEGENKENLLLFLIKKDNTGEKKPLASVKN